MTRLGLKGRKLAGALSVGLCCCGDVSETPPVPDLDPSLSRDAKMETVRMLSEDLEATRHPSDGGGRAWIVEPASSDGPEAVPVGSRQRFVILYETGPLGIAEGGALYLQPSPFWDWDSPQSELEEAPGYTVVETEAAGIELEATTLGGILAIQISGRRLEEGERIRIVYGAGPARARVDRYAEHRSPIWIAVDGDGDGIRSVLPQPPSVQVAATEASRLLLTLPSTARPGQPIRLTVAVLDALGNAGVSFRGKVVLDPRPDGLTVAEQIVLEPEHQGHRTVTATATKEGVFRLSGEASSDGRVLVSESNPLIVRDDIPRLVWADLHGHSQLSDGTGTPEDYFRYAREVAALDVAALTDHDHWGMRFLDQTPEMWQEIWQVVRRFNEPGRFVALAGYEWTSWLYGHRHVLFFDDQGEVYSSMDSRYETPPELWEALAGQAAITVAHHTAGGPISTSWDFIPDPHMEPVTEIVSVHGSSEAADSPGRIYDPVEGNYARDVLDRGLRFGFIGSGDSHDGHPGLAHLASPGGGLAAIFTEDVDRKSLLQALRRRRVYATNGPRIWLRMWLDDYPMGSILPPASGETEPQSHQLKFSVATPAPIERVDVIRSGRVIDSLSGQGRREWSEQAEIPLLAAGEYLYVRVVQEDGGVAWASPIYVGER